MMLHRTKKQALTLLEIMIVIFLIGIIGSAIGYNMRGSLEKGKAFKTERAIEQIHDVLMLEVAKGTPIDQVINNAQAYLDYSGMVKDPAKLLKDGWGVNFLITSARNGNDISVKSEALNAYKARQRAKLGQLATPSADETTDEEAQ